MPNNQVNVTELNRRECSSAPLRLLMLMRDLEVFADELRAAEETLGQPVWTYQDPLVERLRRVGLSDQKVEDFSAWRRTISSLTSGDPRDENQLAKIVAAEAAGLTLLAELVISLRKTYQSARRVFSRRVSRLSNGVSRGLVALDAEERADVVPRQHEHVRFSEDLHGIFSSSSRIGPCVRSFGCSLYWSSH